VGRPHPRLSERLAAGCRDRILPDYPCPHLHLSNGAPVNTRTIAILALVIAVVLLIIFLV
jgi:hypothetical protein